MWTERTMCLPHKCQQCHKADKTPTGKTHQRTQLDSLGLACPKILSVLNVLGPGPDRAQFDLSCSTSYPP